MNSSAFSRMIATPQQETTSPLSHGGKAAHLGESLASTTMMNSTKDALSCSQVYVSKILTAPIYALSRPLKKYSISNKVPKHPDEAVQRLYDHSKAIHHTLRDDPLRYLPTIMKELD